MIMKKNSPVEILLVEDNSNDLELMLYTLKENKIANHVGVVRDGEQALDFLFCQNEYVNRNINNQPKLILLDLKLPKIDGLEVLKALKNNSNTQSIPVVILTSSREEKDLVEGYKLGANSYMVKPIDFIQFADSVREIGLYWLLYNVVIK